MIEVMLRAAAVAVAAVLCAASVRRGAPDIALVLSLAAGTAILLLSAQAFEQVLSVLRLLARLSGLEEELLGPVVKAVGI